MSVSSQSAKFPASLESFQRVWEVYMKSGKFPAEWTDSEQSGKFLDSVNMCSMINMACKQMQFIHIYVAKAIYALFVAKTIYPLYLESFCAWYSGDRKVFTFYVSALDHLSQAPGTAPIFSPCGVNGGNPKGCLAGRDLRPKGSRFCLFRIFYWFVDNWFSPDVLLTLTMGLGLTGGNKRNINFRMRPQPGDAVFREKYLNFVTDHQKHRKNCECCRRSFRLPRVIV